ncbi:MAG: hypothetical protein COT80_02345 [Candidatus Buchananbacteria bacterium CG10_big_fil_rev_8_21_14_0_10_33_19]|uniref:Uncharacterized protein n=1 Tax=Candidatus Buchananbacteria bacterium CG10_big_fil_rev_8_21_14_0_10_33_19 TaxID=1974525 RepID=A0A2H0W4E0_9BACT|nr:MAG: hypothetical protein COT80_02345 [Candidatus Buchananbacteria bacterium CG10_big_fil_rev_8_21_14_0_10_33_19]
MKKIKKIGEGILGLLSAVAILFAGGTGLGLAWVAINVWLKEYTLLVIVFVISAWVVWMSRKYN